MVCVRAPGTAGTLHRAPVVASMEVLGRREMEPEQKSRGVESERGVMEERRGTERKDHDKDAIKTMQTDNGNHTSTAFEEINISYDTTSTAKSFNGRLESGN